MSDGLFNSHTKEHRPLSNELWRRVRTLDDKLAAVQDLDGLESLVAALDSLLADLNITPPTLGGTQRASQREGDTRWNQDRSMGVPTTRHYVAVQVFGDTELLRCWPDATGADLPAVDDEFVGGDGSPALQHASEEQVTNYWDASLTWTLGSRTRPSGDRLELALFTHVDLTVEEEGTVARGELDIRGTFQERRERIEPIVEAITRQTNEFFSTTLPERLHELIEGKRTQLLARRAVYDSLDFPDEWKLPAPELAPPAELPSEEDAPTADSAAVLDFDPRSRLSPVTFDLVQQTIRLWADAVERYPETFALLEEDRLSDLLAATLNATVPGAQREVYTRNGKSDIFIQADVLDAGRGPASVFICESKWATGRAVIREALDPQLFGYLNVHDTAAILLILTPHRGNFAATKETYINELEKVAGHLHTEDGPVQGWPVLEFENEGRRVHVCAAFIHLPR